MNHGWSFIKCDLIDFLIHLMNFQFEMVKKGKKTLNLPIFA